MYNMGNQHLRVVTAYRKSQTAYTLAKRSYNSENPTPPATPATTGAGSTPNPSATTGGDEGKTPATPNASTQPNTETKPDAKTPLTSLPPDVQQYIDDLRKEAETYRKEKKVAELAAKKAEEDTLANQQKWQELAEKRAQRIAELEPVALQLEEINTAFEATLTAKLEALPEDVRKELEPVRASMKPVEFSKWLDTMIPRFTRKPANLDAGAGGTNGKRTLGKSDIKPAAY